MKIFIMMLVMMSFNLQANECLELSKCIEHISKLTGKKYLYEGKLKGELQATTNLQIDSTNADTLFTYILNVNGYARVPTSEKDTYKIIEARDIRYSTTPAIHTDKSHAPNIVNNEDYLIDQNLQ